MKYLLPLCTVALLAFSTNAWCSDVLKVKTIKTELTIPFTDQTLIATIKQVIQTDEGIPVNQQRLTKAEGWALGLGWPQKVAIVLEDNQTCGQYDLQNNQVINLSLRMPKSQRVFG